MSNKYLKLSQAALPKCGQGKQPLQSRVSLLQWTCKSREWWGKSRAWSAADFTQWRLQRHHNKFPLPACVSAQGKSVVLQLCDVGARKAFTRSTWFSASQNRRCPPRSTADEVTLTAPGGDVQPSLPDILCTSLMSCWNWGRSLLHHLKSQENML